MRREAGGLLRIAHRLNAVSFMAETFFSFMMINISLLSHPKTLQRETELTAKAVILKESKLFRKFRTKLNGESLKQECLLIT